jgi:hypothetical protein
MSARARQCTRAVGRFAVLGTVLFGFPAAATTTLGVAASSPASAPSFAATRNYRVGRNPESVAIGDLNGDRKPDLAVAHADGPSVSVLVNRGDGSFRAARNFATGSEHDVPLSVAIGNLTPDRKPDLAIANSAPHGRGIIVLTNKGGGRFRAERRFVTAAEPQAVAIGELNGDGKPDLVAVSHDDAAVSVLLNKGGGRFAAKVDYRTGAGPGSVAIGDLTGDHKPDLVTSNENVRTVSVLVNKGDGTFGSKRDIRTGRVPTAVAIGDLNADGKPDVAAVNNWSGTISVFTNRGEGNFEPRRAFPTSRSPDAVTIADLNGDPPAGSREYRLHQKQHFGAREWRGWEFRTAARLRGRRGARLSCERRSERRRQGRSRDRAPRTRRRRRSADREARSLHRPGRPCGDGGGREAHARSGQLPAREDPARLLEPCREGSRPLAEAQARDGAAEARQGRRSRQPRAQVLTARRTFTVENPQLRASRPRSFPRRSMVNTPRRQW